MDAAQALADLTEISSQIEAAVLLGPEGELIGSTLQDEERSQRIARAAWELLERAEQARADGREPLAQLEAATLEGSVFVVRDGERAIAATTSPDPTVGLVFYDLKSCLRSVAATESAKPKRRRRSAAVRGNAGAET